MKSSGANPELEALWEALCATSGDQSAFCAFYEATRRLVWTLCVRLLRNEEDAADAFQASYTRLLALAREHPSHALEQTPRELLYQCTIREALNLGAKSRRRARKEIIVNDLPKYPDTRSMARDQLSREEVAQRVEVLLAQLPEKLQLPLRLHYFHGLSHAEIAHVLGKTRMTTYRRMAAGLAQLRPMLRRAGLDETVLVAGGLSAGAALLEPPAAIAAVTVYQQAQAALAAAATGSAATGPLAALLGKSGLASGGSAAQAGLLALIAVGVALIIAVLNPTQPVELPPPLAAPTGGHFAGWTGTVMAGEAKASLTEQGELALSAPDRGSHLAQWTSPENWLPISTETVWRLRARVRAEEAQAGHTPLWGLIVEGPHVQQEPTGGGVYLFMDNVGGANAPKRGGETAGRDIFEIWYCPPEIDGTLALRPTTDSLTTQTAVGPPGLRVSFALFDVEEAGYGAEHDAGRIVLENLEATSFPLAALKAGAVVYELNKPDLANGDNRFSINKLKGDWFRYEAAALARSPGALDASPRGILSLDPGSSAADMEEPASVRAHWPIDWRPNTLYRIEAELSAPSVYARFSPPDSIRLGFDAATQELLGYTYFVPRKLRGNPPGAASGAEGQPDGADVQTYVAYFYSHSRSAVQPPVLAALRPRLTLEYEPGRPAGGAGVFAAALKVHALRVREVAIAQPQPSL